MGMLKKNPSFLLYFLVGCISFPLVGDEVGEDNFLTETCYNSESCGINQEQCYVCSDCQKQECCLLGYLGHTEGRWLDNHQGYTTLGVFSQVPTNASSNILPFIDMRVHCFNDGKIAANIGGGLRFVGCNCNQVYGVNVFYDYRDTYWNSKLKQIGVGLEMLSSCWEFRLNGYLPVGRQKIHSCLNQFSFPGGFFATCQQRRTVMGGGDVEIGRWFPFGPCNDFNFYAGIGSYFYFPENTKQIYGAQGRLILNVGRYLTLEAKGGIDRVFHGMGQGTIILTLPFDYFCCRERTNCQPDCCMWDVLCRPVIRQQIIATTKKDCCWTWNWD